MAIDLYLVHKPIFKIVYSYFFCSGSKASSLKYAPAIGSHSSGSAFSCHKKRRYVIMIFTVRTKATDASNMISSRTIIAARPIIVMTLVIIRSAMPIVSVKEVAFKRGEIRKQAKSLKSSRLWTAGKQVTTE